MKFKITLFVLVAFAAHGQTKISDMPAASTLTGTELVPVVQGGSNKKATVSQFTTGLVPVARSITINGVTQDLSLNRTYNVGDLLSTNSYSNPSWITSLAWGKITGAPAFLTTINTLTGADQIITTGTSGTDVGVSSSGVTHTINIPNASGSSRGALTSSDWTNFNTAFGWGNHAGLYAPISHTLDGHSNVTITSNTSGEILKWNGSAWVNNTLAEAGIQPAGTYATGTGSATGTNTGDQTITLTGDVTGSGTGSFAATIANNAVTTGKMADVGSGTLFYRKTAGTGDPETQSLATLKTDLLLTGTNSGDQTSIVGITGTKAQFNTAVTDGDIQYVGDAPTAHTLDSHSNVTITANSAGEILKWSGTAWINNTLAEAGIQAAGTYATGTGSANGTNTGDVSLAGTPDYITISGQTITRGLIDLAADITGTLPSSQGGAGAVNGIMKANGSGTVSAVTIGSGLSFDGTTLTNTGGGGGGLTYAQAKAITSKFK